MLRKDNITVHCHPTNNVPHIYLGTLIEDAPTKERNITRPKGHEHPGTTADKVEGQPELNESSKGEGHDDGKDDGPNSAASLV